jgi:hypothetical protein
MADEPDGGTDRALEVALRRANEIFTNEDRRVERRPGYDPEATIAAAVELAGAVHALDALIRAGRRMPQRWSDASR